MKNNIIFFFIIFHFYYLKILCCEFENNFEFPQKIELNKLIDNNIYHPINIFLIQLYLIHIKINLFFINLLKFYQNY